MTPRFLVYGLVDPRTGDLRYVGKSSSGMTRPHHHLSAGARKRNTHLGHWLAELYGDIGRGPAILVLRECSCNEEALSGEIELIARFRGCDFDLVNATDGGQGSLGRPVTQKTREAVGRASRNRVYTPEMLARLKESHKHVKPPEMTPERKARMIAKLTGRKQSQEERAKKSEASKLVWSRPGYRESVAREKKRRFAEDGEYRQRALIGLRIGWLKSCEGGAV